MNYKLKLARLAQGLSERDLAEELGVKVETYRKWEAQIGQVPKTRIPKLAELLQMSEIDVSGRVNREETVSLVSHRPEKEHYGEVAFHFAGGGKSLLLSISIAELPAILHAIDSGATFVVVRSLSNQIVCVRSEAVSDVWVQYEGCDDYGPEHGSYEHIPYLVNDIEHWRIIERLSYDQDDDEGFDAEDFERVAATVFPTDRYLESMKESGDFSDVEYEKELEKFRIRANKIEELATLVKYQFSNGTMRSVDCYAQEVELYGALHELVIYGPDMDPGEICAPICLEIEGRYKRAWINPKTIDYISVPAHQYDIGSVLASIEDD